MKATTRCPAFSAAPAPTSARPRRRRAISNAEDPHAPGPNRRFASARAARSALVRAALLTGALAASVSPRLFAHHSFAAEFDASKPVTLEGTVARLEWTNPHAWLYLNVPGAGGDSVQWALELSAPNALARRGLRPDLARPGTKLTVTGYRAKNGRPAARAWLVVLPGGQTIDLGSVYTKGAG
jgi:Family of unknown function (DUF6152)